MDLHYHLNDKVKALKSTEVEIMVAQNTLANLVYGARANGVHTAVIWVESLKNGMKPPGNAVDTREIPGHFCST